VLQISQTYRISAQHPCLAGHFPNAPVVPGVILLDYARDLLQNWQPTLQIKTLLQAKFLQPLFPEQDFTITLTQISARKIKFTAERQDANSCVFTTLISGAFAVENKP
jgi:3-hydroxymyristoyl/3-hydroxydecanoyl-(acyl carrier protein) dehydratase